MDFLPNIILFENYFSDTREIVPTSNVNQVLKLLFCRELKCKIKQRLCLSFCM